MSMHHDWLSLIEISGPFLAIPVLKEAFPQGLEELDFAKRKRLRQAYDEWQEALETGDPRFDELHAAWIGEVLARGLELDEDGRGDVLKRRDWCAANVVVDLPEHGVRLSPEFAVVADGGKPLLLIQTHGPEVDLEATQRLDGWASTPAERMVALCRATGCRLGLVTNGERWMLVDAPVGAVTTFASWYARLWGQEPVTLQAFVHLLGIRRFFVDESERLPALLDRSLKYQDEVTDALGEQVRRAVEVLVQALDKADQDRDRELLRGVKEAELYEAALTVMMRLVFLLCAEERGLLLLGDERYEAHYAVSTLRMQLRAEAEEILERRWDAWSRLLAVFRAVHGGIEHENLRLPALGGSLFDPDRFPFLEGRAKGSHWRTDAAKPLPIDNRTVLLLLESIQTFEGRTLSYRALDEEQIGGQLRRILEAEGGGRFASRMEPHDSWYIGSDVFYTYIVHNGWWKLFMRQKTKEGYFSCAAELREKLLTGRFPENIRERFMRMLEHYGQSPIIVRSSSLLEDQYGNAFAGKYESVFRINRGTPEERYEAFEQAVRTVYASAMNEDALVYRQIRGLAGEDEQMALLVQRVSGDEHGDGYFPHAAGVGHSTNLYVWDTGIDMNAGMLRLVFGLGTRAVDRTEGDYARVVCLDDPRRQPPMHAGDRRKYAQHEVDLLSFREGGLVSRDADAVLEGGIKADRSLIAVPDDEAAARMRELGITDRPKPWIVDFRGLLERTDFPAFMREMLERLAAVYEYPVDIEFTVNFTSDGGYRVNLLQCRPLQTRGLGRPVELPEPADDCFFAARGSFMGGNVRLPIDHVVFVRPDAYLALPEQGKYAVARLIGRINKALKGRQAMLVGPGRWGTSTPSLGVPVHFAEICHAAVLCEVAPKDSGIAPELSYGSHFFLDLVEAGIFYAALMPGEPDVVWHPERVLERPNALIELVPDAAPLEGVVHVARTNGMEIFADIGTQRVVCR